MSVAVRYYSRSGNTKALAEAIAGACDVTAVSVDGPSAAIDEPVDVLFVGGALYAYGIDAHLKDFLASLKPGIAKKAVVFSTSWVSKHALDLIRKGLTSAGIAVVDETLYVRNKPSEQQLADAAAFAKGIAG